MKIEWLLGEFDKHVRAYTKLRAELNDVPPDSDVYKQGELEVHKQIRLIEVEARNILDAVDEVKH